MPTLSTVHRYGLTALTALAMASALPAHALGRLADVQVIDRDKGEVLPLYQHRGDYWVAGRPGARYAVSLQNRQGARVLTVVSIDGVNAISGETAAFNQTGYVLDAWQNYRVTGWRKSDDQVAAFHFAAAPASYAARTGRPEHMGVIGVAVFREKSLPRPPAIGLDKPWGAAPSEEGARAFEAPEATAKNALPEDAMAQADAASATQRRMAPAAPAVRLGTGHGAREDDHIGHTQFERRRDRPDEIVRIRYDSRENLVAMGIIRELPVPPQPNPFPDGKGSGYAPDPD